MTCQCFYLFQCFSVFEGNAAKNCRIVKQKEKWARDGLAYSFLVSSDDKKLYLREIVIKF